jgi:hypothetical protein
MIIFDASVLNGLSVTGPVVAILRRIADSSGLTLAISRVTEYEHGARKLREFEKKIESARTSHGDLRHEAPDWHPPEFDYPSPAALMDRHMERVRHVFNVLPLDGSHAMQALRREAFRERPASVDPAKKGSGARDVVIWLTAVEQSRLAGAAVYLVASDHRAFGENVLYEELKRDAAVNDAEVILITSTEELIAKFARHINIEVDTVSLLREQAVTRAVTATMSAAAFMAAVVAAAVVPNATGLSGGPGVDDLELIRAEAGHVYEVHDQRWIAARGTWRGHQVMMRFGDESRTEWDVQFQQRLTVLLSMHEGDSVANAEVMGWDDVTILNAPSR